jgi:hypothetical protein
MSVERYKENNRYIEDGVKIISRSPVYKMKGGDGYTKDCFLSEREVVANNLESTFERFAVKFEMEVSYFDTLKLKRKTIVTTIHVIEGSSKGYILGCEGVTGFASASSFSAALAARENPNFLIDGENPTIVIPSDLHSKMTAQFSSHPLYSHNIMQPFTTDDYVDMDQYAGIMRLSTDALKQGNIISGQFLGGYAGSLGAWLKNYERAEKLATARMLIIVDGAMRAWLETNPVQAINALRRANPLITRYPLLPGLDFIRSGDFQPDIENAHLVRKVMQEEFRNFSGNWELEQLVGDVKMPPLSYREKNIQFEISKMLEKLSKKFPKLQAITGYPEMGAATIPVLRAAMNTVWKESDFNGKLKLYYSTKSFINSARAILGDNEWVKLLSTIEKIKKSKERFKENTILRLLEEATVNMVASLRKIYPNAEIEVILDSVLNHRSQTSLIGVTGELSKV